MEIRTATHDDRDAVWALLEPVFRAGDTYAVDPDISCDAALAYWIDAAAACYVVVDADCVIGTYYIKTNQQGGGAHVCNCGYIAGAQGRGVATAMCEASQAQARNMGYRAMQFNLVLSSNTGAMRLWHKLGFETVGIIPQAFDHPSRGFVDAYVMFKQLAAI